MTKLLIPVIFMFLLIGCDSKDGNISDKNKNSGWIKENLFGKVKSINEVLVFSDKSATGSASFFYFNKAGLLTEWKLKNNQTEYSTTYQYDDKGNIIRSENKGDNNDVTTTKYDAKGKPVESGSNYGKAVIAWNEKGNESRISQYNLKGELLNIRVTLFDDKNLPVEYNVFNQEGKFTLRGVMEYDKNDKLLKKSYFNSDGKYRNGFSWKYDERGNAIEENQYGEGNTLIETITNEYKYDKTGNWIEKTEYIMGRKNRVLNRIYEYY